MTGLRSISRKGTGLILSSLMVVSMMPIDAFATIMITPENTPQTISDEVKEPVFIRTNDLNTGKEGDVSADIRSIETGENGEYIALGVGADNGNTASVTVGSVDHTYSDGTAVYLVNGKSFEGDDAGGTAEVTITGNVNGAGTGIWTETYHNGESSVEVNGNVNGASEGIYAKTDDIGKTVYKVTGNVNSDGDGIYARSLSDGVADLTIVGDIIGNEVGVRSYAIDGTLTKTKSGGENNLNIIGNVSGGVIGIYTKTDSDGENRLNITGNVSGTGEYEEVYGIYSYLEGGKSDVTVNGNVKGKMAGVFAGAYDGGIASVKVNGNVTADKVGIGISSGSEEYAGPLEAVDVFVDGTVTGGEAGIGLTDYSAEQINVTAWKITQNKDGWIAAIYDYDEDDNFVMVGRDEEFEKTVNYIVKVEQPTAGATLRASQETAKEGENVYVRIDLQDGYTVTGAFGDEGKSVPLLQDVYGNYYVVVPKGGGVYLSVIAQKIPDPVIPIIDPVIPSGDDTTGNTADNTTVSTPAVSAELQAAITVISSTPTGGMASIAITDSKLDAQIVSLFLARRDINVSITCLINGKPCTILIPAGVDLSDFIRPDGTIDLEKLAAKFRKI